MATRVPQAAVCIITVELAPERTVISVRTVRNLNRNLYSARPEAPRPCADADEALHVAGAFLRSLEDERARSRTETGP